MDILSIDNVNYQLNQSDYTATIIYSPESTGDIAIPKSITVDGLKYIISRIENGSFNFNYDIKSILFPDDSELVSIGENSFADSSLQNILIPKSVTEIGKNAFSNCYQIRSFKFSPNSQLTSISESLFEFSSRKVTLEGTNMLSIDVEQKEYFSNELNFESFWRLTVFKFKQ